MSATLAEVKKSARRAQSKAQSFDQDRSRGAIPDREKVLDFVAASREAVRSASAYRRVLEREVQNLALLEEAEIRPLIRESEERVEELRQSLPPDSEYLREMYGLIYQMRHPVEPEDVVPDEADGREGLGFLPSLLSSISRRSGARPHVYRVIADVSLCGGLVSAFAFSYYGSRIGYYDGALLLGLGYLTGCSVLAVIGSAWCALRRI